MELFVDSSALSSVARFFLSGMTTAAAAGGIKIIEVDDKVRNDSDNNNNNVLLKKVSPKGDLPALQCSLPTATTSFVGLYAVATALAPTDPLLVNANDKKEVEKWIKFVSTELVGLSPKDPKFTGKLHKINKDLLQTTFFLGSQPTIVDLAFFYVLHPVVKDWNEAERLQFSNITRWLDYFQHFENFHNVLKLPIIKIKKDVTSSLLEKTAQDKPDTKQQKPKQENTPEKEKVEPQTKQPAPKKEDKKELATKQAEKQEEKVDVSRLDIRVGKIVSVKVHEEADTLYVEQIDVGEAKPRTVVSGLRKFVPIEEMQNRLVIVLCNLKPTKLKGVLSEAMVLAASNNDHTKVELLTPLEGSTPGERVSFDGYPGQPDEQLNPKKKVWETVQPEFTTTDDCVAVYKNVPFKTSVGVIKVKSITKGVVK